MKRIILIVSIAIGTLLMASCGSIKCIKAVQASGHSYIDDVDDHGSVTFSEVVEVGKTIAEDIFTKANTFFVYNYNSSNSVIQQSDKERGLIIGKGLWSDVYTYSDFAYKVRVSAKHILRVDTKDGRARITVTVQSVDYVYENSNGKITKSSYNPADLYPFVTVPKVKRGYNINACIAMAIETECQNLMNRLENDLKHGSTSKSIEEDDNW